MKKVLFFLFFGILISAHVHAQSTCAGAMTLVSGTQYCGTNSYAGTMNDDGATAPLNPCDSYYSDGEYWFKFVGTGVPLSLAVSGLSGTYSGLFVFDACPAASTPNCVASYESGSSSANFTLITPALTLGTTYYIVLANWSTPYSVDFCLTGTALTSYPMTTAPLNICSGVYMDPQGGSNYTDNSGTITQTVCSSAGNSIVFDFDVFETNETADNLKIYDGPTTASPLIGTYSQTNSPGVVVSSGTCLTFSWTTDGNQASTPGWMAYVSCVVPPAPSEDNSLCAGAEPFCTGTTYNFPAGVDAGDGELGPDYGCLYSTPNPIWYFLKIQNAGPIEIYMTGSALSDIDFACWGPFSSPLTPCTSLLTSDETISHHASGASADYPSLNMIDCSYNSSYEEWCYIPNAQVGQYYLLIITNFSNDEQNIVFSQTGGTGATDCSILAPPITNNGPLCVGETLELGVTNPVTGASYIWSGPNGFSSTQMEPTITSVTTANAGTYSLVISLGTETSAPVTTTVVVNPNPIAGANASPATVCAGVSTTVSATSSVAGSTFAWSTGATGASISVTPSATTTYTVTATANGCTGSATVQVTVTPLPNATAGSNSPVCSGGTLNLTSSGGTVYSWAGPNSFSSAQQNPSIASVTPAASGTYTVTVTNAGCSATAGTTVTVNATPAPVPSSNSPVCAGTTLNLSVLPNGGTAYSWSGPSTYSSAQQNPSISSVSVAASGTYTVTVTLTGGCTASATTSVTVNPLPTPTASSNAPICEGASLNFTAGGGANYSWAGPNSFGSNLQNPVINPVTAAATGTYTVTVTSAANCSATTTTTVSLSPVDNPAFLYTPATLCITGTDTPATITGGASGTFSSSPPGLVFLNTATGLIDVSASTIGSYTVTFTTNGGCTASATANLSITSAPDATISYGGPYCPYDTDPLPSFGSGASGGVFSSTAGLSINSSTGLVDLSASTPGTYTITNFIAAAGGCASASDDASIVINPTPTVTVPADLTVCNGASVPAASLSGTPSGVSYTWTNSNSSIGLAAAGGGAPLGFTAANSGTSPVSGAITIVPAANGCTGVAQTYTITVNPTPVANVPASVFVCNGATVAAVSLSGTPPGVNLAWTNSNTAIGLAAGGTGSVPSFTASNSTSSNATATISISPSANGCTGTSVNYTITVYPTPTATVTADASYCTGVIVPVTPPMLTPVGANFSWTNSNTAIGLAASGSGVVPSFTTTNSASGTISGIISVTPTANGCMGTAATYTLTVYPVPTVSVPVSAAYCTGATVPSGVLTGNPAGVSFAWTNSNTGIGLGASGNGNIPGFNAVNTGSTPVSGIVTVSPTANGCTGNTTTYTLTINPLPTLNFPALSDLCVGSSALTLNMATPAGGTYSGTGVSGTSFNPATSGAGTFTLTYSYTDGNGCSNTTTQNITVNASPTANFTISPTVGCVSVPVTATYTGNGGAGASFAWSFNGGSASPGTGAGPQSVSWATAGNYTVSLTVTENGCPSVAYTQNVSIGKVIANGQLTQHVSCNGLGDGIATVNVSGGASPYDYNWNSSPVQTTASATALVPGTYVVIVTDDAGCTASSSVTITEPTALLADITDSLMVACYGLQTGMAKVTASGGTLPYSYAWASSSSTTSQVSNYPAGSYSVTVTDDNGCEVIVPFTITQNPQLSLDLLPTDEGCENSCSGYILTQVNGGLGPYTYSWNNASTADSLVNLCPGNYSLSVSDAAGCVVTGSTSILTNTYLSATADVSPLMGIAPSEISFTYTGTGGTLFEWDFGDGSTSTSMNPVHTYSAEGVYTVTLIVNSGNPDHCEEVFTIEITIYPPSSIEIPNVYTPNGDGFNDAFLVKSVGLDRESMLIFNRWGRKVAEWSELHGQWDGRMDGGAEAATGEYFYIFDAAGYDGKEYKINGTVTLLR